MMKPGLGSYIGRAAASVLVLLALSCSKDNSDVYLSMTFNPSSISASTRNVFLQVASNTDWTLSFSEEGQPDWVNGLSTFSGSGDRNSIMLSLKSNLGEDSRSVTVVAKGGGIERRATLVQRGIGNSSTVWIELPKKSEGANRETFTHFMKVDGNRTRNYTYCFDYENRLSIWVAYPLYSACMGKSGRTEAWGVDPNIPLEKQPILACNPETGSGGAYQSGNNGWYARGHQCPSADRTADADMNRQTYYGTNMTPQINDRFNATVWANLETKVRSWSQRCDTLYVITGCVLDGSKYYVWDNPSAYNSLYHSNYPKKKVTVPTGYFKAVIRFCSNSTVGFQSSSSEQFNGSFIGLAAFLDHKEYSNGTFTKNYTMSIDELEEKLGYDLFAALPDIVGEEVASKIEAEIPSRQSWWGLN